MIKTLKRTIIFIVALCLLIPLSACQKKDKGPELQAKNLMRTISEDTAEPVKLSDEYIATASDFSVNIFKTVATKQLKQAENSLISPTALLSSLSLASSGADGTTKEEFKRVLSSDMDFDEFSKMNSSFLATLKSSGSTGVKTVSSMWIDSNVTSSVKEDFLINNAKYYGADIYKSDFTSKTTNKDINKWISYRTDNRTTSLDVKISKNEVVYLIDSLVFDGIWETSYKSSDMTAKEFEAYNGDIKTTDFMVSRDVTYLADSYAVGFSKNYNGGKYSFVALLPNEHISISDYITMLNGDILNTMLNSKTDKKAVAQMPQFNTTFFGSAKPYLTEIGFNKIFDKKADFTKIMRKEETTYIADVIQSVSFKAESGVKNENQNTANQSVVGETVDEVSKEMLVFNRPFVYAVIDNTTKIPLLIGTVLTIN